MQSVTKSTGEGYGYDEEGQLVEQEAAATAGNALVRFSCQIIARRSQRCQNIELRQRSIHELQQGSALVLSSSIRVREKVAAVNKC